MSFWDLSNEESYDDVQNGSFDQGGGDIEPLPNNTICKAAIEEAKWAEYEGDKYINLRWTVLAPDDYKNHKIFQKIRVNDADPKKSDKAKKMLFAIDSNSGGQLIKEDGLPTDETLQQALTMKMMFIQVMVWSMKGEDGETKRGNWVKKVSKEGKAEAPKPQPKSEDTLF